MLIKLQRNAGNLSWYIDTNDLAGWQVDDICQALRQAEAKFTRSPGRINLG